MSTADREGVLGKLALVVGAADEKPAATAPARAAVAGAGGAAGDAIGVAWLAALDKAGGRPGILNAVLHSGQRTDLPASSAGALSCLAH